jgi:hypothetical protein
MSSLSVISEQILMILGKTTDDSDIDQREIKLNVKQAAARSIRMRWFEGKNFEGVGEVDGSVVNRFNNQSVLQDSDTEEYYTLMPADPVDIPGGVGIRRVSPMKDLNKSYRPVPDGFCGLYEGLEGFSLEGNIGFYIEGKRIYYVGMKSGKAPEKVRVTMVLGIDSLDENQEINIPPDMEAEIIQYVVQLYSAYRKDDEVNDNVDQL